MTVESTSVDLNDDDCCGLFVDDADDLGNTVVEEFCKHLISDNSISSGWDDAEAGTDEEATDGRKGVECIGKRDKLDNADVFVDDRERFDNK